MHQEKLAVRVPANRQENSQGTDLQVFPSFTVVVQRKKEGIKNLNGTFRGLVEQHGCNIQSTGAESLLQVPSLQMVQCSILFLSLESLHLLFHVRSSCHCV